MRRILLAGALLAVLGAVAVFVGQWLDLGLRNTLYGAAIGAALGLVGDKAGLGGRLGGFLLGVVFAWVGYAIRAVALPDTAASQAIALVIVVLFITLASALSGNRLPLWSGLLGAAALFGAYDFLYAAAPYNFLSESVVVVSGLLVTVGLGLLAGVVANGLDGDESNDLHVGHRGDDAGLAVMSGNQGES